MKRKKGAGAGLLCAVLLTLCVAGGTTAFLQTRSQQVENVFSPGRVSCAVEEDFHDGVKQNVTIRNTGNTESYLRAAVMVTWSDGEGNVLPQLPVEGQEYSITYNTDDWLFRDGIWYCAAPVAPGEAAPVLVAQCIQNGESPSEGYAPFVQILGDAIQSKPARAVQESWGVSLDSDGRIGG